MKDKQNAFLELLDKVTESACCDTQIQSIAEAMATVRAMQPQLPVWLTDATLRRFGDMDELIVELPHIINECYNTNEPAYVLTPEAVLTRRGEQAFVSASNKVAKEVRFVHVKNDGSVNLEGKLASTLLLCPGRFHSMQIAGISKRLSQEAVIVLLSLDEREDLAAAVRENDIKMLEFLLARWVIETQPETKGVRLTELIAQIRALAGGGEVI